MTIHQHIDQWIGENPDNVGVILNAVVSAIWSTAQHVESNWQDHETTKRWTKIAMNIDAAEMHFQRNKPY